MDPVNPNNSQPSTTTSSPVVPSIDAPPVPSGSAVVATAATTAPMNPPLPGNNPSQPVQTGHVEKSNALIYIFIAILIIVLIGLMGLFFYNKLSTATSTENKIVVPTTEPMATPTVVIPTYTSPEQKDAMGVEVGGVDSQLNIIEQDINKL